MNTGKSLNSGQRTPRLGAVGVDGRRTLCLCVSSASSVLTLLSENEPQRQVSPSIEKVLSVDASFLVFVTSDMSPQMHATIAEQISSLAVEAGLCGVDGSGPVTQNSSDLFFFIFFLVCYLFISNKSLFIIYKKNPYQNNLLILFLN